MRIYNPQNQYGEDLITKKLVTTITGLEGTKDGKNLDERVTALEGASPAEAIQEIEGDTSDAIAKITFTEETKDGKVTAIAHLSTEKATVSTGVISGAGAASGDQVATAIATETTRATGVEGALANLTTDVKTNLVNAINEVDAHADTAQAEVDALESKVGEIPDGATASTVVGYAAEVAAKRLQSIEGNDGGGVSVQFTTDGSKAVSTTVQVTESTVDDETKKFATTDKNVATGAKVQEAIDAAEARAIAAAETKYGADEKTIHESRILGQPHKFSAITTEGVASGAEGLATGGQIYTAIESAKTALTGSATVSGTDVTIKGAMKEAEDAQATADARLASITGGNAAGVSVDFTTDGSKAVTTTVAVTSAATTGTGDAIMFNEADNGKVATAGNIQLAINAAEARAKAAAGAAYSADGVTIDLSADKKFSAITTDGVGQNIKGLTTGGQVYTAIEGAKTALIGTDSTADTIKHAQYTADNKLSEISGGTGQGVGVAFTTNPSTKAVTTAITVTESTLVTDTKFSETDTNVATGAKVQLAINAAEERAKAAQTYTADGTTITLTGKQFSATTAAVTEGGTALTTGGQVATAIGVETTRATGVEDAIKADIGAWSDGSKYASSTVKGAIETISAINMFRVVNQLPEVGEPNIIYLVKKTEGENSYEEWIYVEVSAGVKKWEKIGDTDIKLGDYYKKDEIGAGFSTSSTVKAYIEAQDQAVKDTADTATGTSADSHVTVNLTGTVGAHGLTVTTSDIAAASVMGTPTAGKTVVQMVEEEATRAKGVEGNTVDLKTDTRTTLVAAINEVDTNADAIALNLGAKTDAADSTGSAFARIAATKAVADTAVQVVESATTSGTVRLTVATSGTTRTLSIAVDDATISQKGVVQLSSDGTSTSETVAATPKAVSTAVSAAKTELIGTATVTGSDVTIKGAMAEAEAADAKAVTAQTTIDAVIAGTKHIVGEMLELGVKTTSTTGQFEIDNLPTDVATVHIVRVEWNHEDFMCKHTGTTITMWDGEVPQGATMPQASEIKVFALVKTLMA